MFRSAFIGLLVVPVLTAGAAEAHRHHGPHVHGEATLNIGQDGALLVIGLEAPGMSLLGFEHPPHDDEQRARYRQTLDVLHKPDIWLSLPARAGCVLASSQVTPNGFDEKAASGSAAHEHADFDASYQYRCRVPLALKSLDIALTDRFPELHKVNVEIVVPNWQGSQVLLPGSDTVTLSK